MKGIFVDTSAWYALLDRLDPDHAGVISEVSRHRSRLFTSNFVLDETLTLLRYRLGLEAAGRFGERLRDGNVARLLRVSAADEDRAWEIFRGYKDKTFSFTDCTSFALMQRLELSAAIALDDDFRAFGLRCLPGL